MVCTATGPCRPCTFDEVIDNFFCDANGYVQEYQCHGLAKMAACRGNTNIFWLVGAAILLLLLAGLFYIATKSMHLTHCNNQRTYQKPADSGSIPMV